MIEEESEHLEEPYKPKPYMRMRLCSSVKLGVADGIGVTFLRLHT